MTEDRNGKTYSFDVCSKCELICCKDADPPLTRDRKEILIRYLKDKDVPATILFGGEEYSHPVADENGFCTFYNKETRKCSVHPIKPETCRAGPITFDINLKTRKVEFYLKKAELCAFAGILYEDKAGLMKHLEVAKQEILQLIRNLDADALKNILNIPEPQTFKIDENDLPKEVMNKLHLL
jgi:Fe-S-cluster containining protein